MSERIEGYRPALDGIRALALLTVLAYHSSTGWAPGGFLAVDVFFVLSGYLITGLLLAEHRAWGSVDLLSFYAARARRLLPALLLVVTTVCIVGPHVLTEAARSSLRGDAVASLLYVANWRFIVEGESYFAQFGDPSPLRHLWTLAIEEQFYVVFPVVLTVLLGVVLLTRRQFALTLIAVAAVSVAVGISLHTPGEDPSRIYYGTDARMYQLLVGAVLAVLISSSRRPAWLLPDQRRGWRSRACGVGGAVSLLLVLLCFVVAQEEADYVFLGGSLVFAVLVACLITAVEMSPHAMAGRIMSLGVLVWIGRMSYGLYLWHWPVMVLISESRTGWDPIPLFTVQIFVTGVLAAGSYFFVEQPIRRGGLRRLARRPRLTVAAAAVPLALAVVLVGTTGVASAPPAAAPGETLTTAVGAKDAPVRIHVVGDSVGFALAYSFPIDAHPDVAVEGTIKSGCGTAEHWLVVNGVRHPAGRPDCEQQFAEWAAVSARFRPTVTVWTMGGWEVYDHFVDGRTLTVGSNAYREHLLARMERGLQSFEPSSQVVIPNVPCYNQPRIVEAGQDTAPDRNDRERAVAVNEVIEEFASRHADRVHVIDVASWLCPGGRFQRKIDGVDMREDGVHYRSEAVPAFWTWALPQIERATGR